MTGLTLYLLRHGETEASRDGGYCGRSDPELTDTGLQMAEDFASVYHDHPWVGIYASPMRRSTAASAARPTVAMLVLLFGIIRS